MLYKETKGGVKVDKPTSFQDDKKEAEELLELLNRIKDKNKKREILAALRGMLITAEKGA